MQRRGRRRPKGGEGERVYYGLFDRHRFYLGFYDRLPLWPAGLPTGRGRPDKAPEGTPMSCPRCDGLMRTDYDGKLCMICGHFALKEPEVIKAMPAVKRFVP